MPKNAIVVTVDATTAQFDRAMLSAERATQRYGAQLKLAQRAQAEFDATVAKSGASSAEAAAAQERLGAALNRTVIAEQRAAIAAKEAGEIQARSAAQAAKAQEAAVAKQQAALTKQQAMLSRLGVTGGNVGLAVAAGFAVAIKAAADFDAKIAQLTSLLPHAERDLVPQLAAATKGFTDIGASASDAADAEIELVKAGISAKDIMGGALKGALTLAAAGQIDFGQATEIAASAMTQFQLQGKDIPHVADLLAAGADRALGSVQDLGEGMKYTGLGAHQLGISVDDTVAALAEFANAGLIGSQGGTTLQQVLRQLTGPTDKAAEEIGALGLQLYDAHGKFVGLASVAGQLHDKLGSMSQANRDAALNTLFTSRAVRGATILYQDGAKGVEQWQKRVEDANFATDQAKGKLDSLSGDFEKLTAQIKNNAIALGDEATPALRKVTEGISKFLDIEQHAPQFTLLGFLGRQQGESQGIDDIIQQARELNKVMEFGKAHGGLAATENSARALGSAVLDLGVKAQTGMKHVDDSVRAPIQSFDDLAAAAEQAYQDLVKVDQAALTQRGDWRGYQQSIDDATQALKDNGKTLDAHTQKGRDNAAALDTIASSALSYAESISDPALKLDFLRNSRAQLLETAKSFGMSKQAAQDYVNEVLGIPKSVITAAQFEKNAAYNDIETYKKAIDSVPGFKNTVVTAQTQQAIAALARVVGLLGVIHSKDVYINVNTQYTHSGVQAPFADGGPVYGPGSATSDSIPARLSNGEFVVRAAAVEAFGLDRLMRINAMGARQALAAPRTAAVSTFANGGMVSGGAATQTVRIDGEWRGEIVIEGQAFPAYMRRAAKQVVNVNNAVNRNVAAAQAAG